MKFDLSSFALGMGFACAAQLIVLVVVGLPS